jgi:putative aldouronate transport system substrate-binding protein
MPGYWKLMDDGSVVSYSTMPETKEALALLSEWYEEGILNAEFYTVDTGKSVDVIMNGQAGMYFGPYWCPRWPNADTLANERARGNEDAAWRFGLIPEGPVGRGTTFTFPVASALACAKVQVSDEDYIAMLEQWSWVWRLSHPNYAWETKWHGFADYSYEWTEDGCGLIPEREGLGIPTGGGRPDVLIQQREYEYKEFLKEKYDADEPLDCWERATVEATFYSDESDRFIQVRRAYDVAVDAVENYAIGSAYNGAPTPTQIESQGDLDALQNSAFIDIIVGNQPIDYFDEFVEEWKAAGGDQIAQEITDRL